MDGMGWEDIGEASGGGQRRFGGVKNDQEENFGVIGAEWKESRKEDKNESGERQKLEMEEGQSGEMFCWMLESLAVCYNFLLRLAYGWAVVEEFERESV
jgi:hypothetical protein